MFHEYIHTNDIYAFSNILSWAYNGSVNEDTVQPVVRGHLWDKEKVALQNRWSLKRG